MSTRKRSAASASSPLEESVAVKKARGIPVCEYPGCGRVFAKASNLKKHVQQGKHSSPSSTASTTFKIRVGDAATSLMKSTFQTVTPTSKYSVKIAVPEAAHAVVSTASALGVASPVEPGWGVKRYVKPNQMKTPNATPHSHP